MPGFSTALGFHSNVNDATLVFIARNQVDLGHITGESDSKSAALAQLSSDKVLSRTRHLLITRSRLRIDRYHLWKPLPLVGYNLGSFDQ